jgi:RHS repeat-associated protein
LSSATYNSQHEPLTTTDASGQTTTNTYDASGHLLTSANALGQTTNYTYDSDGRLLSVTPPLPGGSTKFTYDAFNRVKSVTDALGYLLQFTYDKADRPLTIKYPDGTTSARVYQLLNLASSTDRLNRKTTFTFDALGRVTMMTDPLGRQTKYAYCDCGSLSQIVDPDNNATTLLYDLQERPSGKQYANGKQMTIAYELTTSRVKKQTDALGQITSYSYNLDDTLAEQTYLSAVNPTKPVSFAWDPNFRRIVSMTDGTGTTTYVYNAISNPPQLGATQLASVTAPQGDTATYTYDALGRPLKQILDGVASQMTYDAIGRIKTMTNALDGFTYSYLGGSKRPTQIKSTNGLVTNYTYYPNTADRRLQKITNNNHAASLISSFEYAYNAEDEITSTIIDGQLGSPVTRTSSHDAAGQLTAMTNPLGGDYSFGYDPGSNRTSEQIGATNLNFTYNIVNAQTAPTPASYNANGEPVSLAGRAFKWDAAHRLISITKGTDTIKFVYDGLDRRTRITRLSGSTVVSDKLYIWCGDHICLETTPAHVVTKRYFSQGVKAGTDKFYYATDNLGSVHELVDQPGTVQASYDYDPFGVRSKLGGTKDSDYGYAGLFHEPVSNLDLATYRAYDPPRARWLNRDPIGEQGGLNLYAYVLNDPTGTVDRLGFCGEGSFFDLFRNDTLTDFFDYFNQKAEGTRDVAKATTVVVGQELIELAEGMAEILTGNGDFKQYDATETNDYEKRTSLYNANGDPRMNAIGMKIANLSIDSQEWLETVLYGYRNAATARNLRTEIQMKPYLRFRPGTGWVWEYHRSGWSPGGGVRG